MKKKFAIHLCLAAGILLLFAQLSLLAIFLYPSYDKESAFELGDVQSVVNVTTKYQLPIFVIDRNMLQQYTTRENQYIKQCTLCKGKSPFTFGILFRGMKDDFGMKLLREFQQVGFHAEIFLNTKPPEIAPDIPTNTPICYLLKRKITIHLVLLQERGGNYWWHGDLRSDRNAVDKLSSFDLSISSMHFMRTEGAFDKFHTDLADLDGISLLVPRDISRFVRDAGSSQYIECNHTMAHSFHSTHGKDSSHEALRFVHRAWKLLSRAKTILDNQRVRFWLSSGTCLGFFRQCDIIPYSRDVDLGIFITDYSESLVPEFEAHGFTLKHWFGRVNDSLEISFLSGDIKLDLFFFYEEGPYVWNGGTQAKSGKKFKYRFPRFSLCWTQFLDLKVRIPCDTRTYIEANYGTDWFTPVREWDWKTSADNVRENGAWPAEEWAEVIRVY